MTAISIGDSVCDKYTGSCGRVLSIINNEVTLEPTIIKRGARGEYLEVTETPIRAKIANLDPDHIRRYEKLGGNPTTEGRLASEVETKDIIALHKQGLSPSEIAAKLGTTYEVPYLRLLRAGFEPHPLPPAVPTEEIVTLHKQGLSPTEIAARVSLSRQAIRGRLLRADFEPVLAPSLVRAAERAGDIMRLHQEGLTPKQIAERLGLKWGLVHKYLREARLAPNPSEEEVKNTLQGVDEIVRLAKGDMPRHQIAARMGSTWSLVAETLEKAGVRAVVPACEDITVWISNLLPLIGEIREARPDTGSVLRKIEQLEKELVAISDAGWTVHRSLPWKGKEVNEERWCIADIHQACTNSLDYMDALKGCIKQLDVAKMPKLVEQAETCITNISNVMSGAVHRVVEKPEEVGNPAVPDKEDLRLVKGLLPLVGVCTAVVVIIAVLGRVYTARQARAQAQDGQYLVSVRYPGQLNDLREFVQPDNPDVLAVYSQIGPDYWSLYDFVCRNINYRRDVGEFFQWPSETLKGNGDCEDTSILLTSLIRAGGTPNCHVALGNLEGYGHSWCQLDGQILETTFTSARVVPNPTQYCPYVLFDNEQVVELWPGALEDVFRIRRDEATKLNLMAEALQ